MKCTICGGIILADTEDWEKPLCHSCWVEAGSPEEECPGENCMMCSDEACLKCGAGCWSNVRDCDHDVIERHNYNATN